MPRYTNYRKKMDYSSAGVLVCGEATPSAGRQGVACEAVPQWTRPSGDGEAKDRGLPLGNLRDDNATTRQKNQLKSPDPDYTKPQ